MIPKPIGRGFATVAATVAATTTTPPRTGVFLLQSGYGSLAFHLDCGELFLLNQARSGRTRLSKTAPCLREQLNRRPSKAESQMASMIVSLSTR
jgi:hypothetical protein